MASMGIFTPPRFSKPTLGTGFSKSTLGTGSALSSEKSSVAILMMNYRSHSLRVRPMSIRSSLEQNAPNSKADTLYGLGKNAAALALSYFFGSLLGREEIAQLLFGQISNLAAKPVHYGVGAAVLLFVMGALIGHKWAKSGPHCPNGTGSALSSEKSPLAVLMMNYRSHSLRVRPMSLRSSLEQNAPNSKAATLYSIGKNAAALALSYFFGWLLGREEIAQLLSGQISNLAAKGTAPVHYGVGAAALLFVMGALIGHKWAAKSGSHCPNAGTCNGSNDSEHMPTDNRPTKRASVKRKPLLKVKRPVKVVNDGVSTSKLIQMLLNLKVVLKMLKEVLRMLKVVSEMLKVVLEMLKLFNI